MVHFTSSLRGVRHCLLVIFSFMNFPALAQTNLSLPPQVDLQLILAIDCSYSVDQYEYIQQMQGIAYALNSKEIREAVQLGHHQKIALTLIQWSSSSNQDVVLPWTLIGPPGSFEAVAAEIARLPRSVPIGSTSLSAVIAQSIHIFNRSPFHSSRRTLDISGDGRNNDGIPVHYLRDVAVKNNITINGLAIVNDIPTLDSYFRSQVTGGFNSFVIKANSYDDYRQAIVQKLVREIGNLPVAGGPALPARP
ncbi:DUF1194 domain-containing protein [Kiloniella laminariae]|uniref:DUF1194 domain-containing protein n=1 Tax=Kiloniella laminariae TaxID=454162 RepID=A0ABT4LL41_9PROT|nr:DUF1194 domain-containing protein [Kiloniella laminariae]MCZ4281792.1 DUF1194 domain-containing protein [Kiloniella laminariae]